MATNSGIVYSSGFVIENEFELSTLATFYDTVYLPHLTPHRDEWDADAWDFMRPAKLYPAWDKEKEVLFKEKVLERLPFYSQYFQQKLLRNENMTETWKLPAVRRDGWGMSNIYDFTIHTNRPDVELPRLYAGNTNRATKVHLEASSIFRYFLPSLNPLTPEETLDLREKVKDTREGFAMHLQKLSKGLDAMVKNGDSLKDLEGYAQTLAETELVPDYTEFRRQLAAEKAGKWKKVLDVSGKVLEIDATPWTPKFWGQLLKALGVPMIELKAEQKEHLTNRYQAFEFMKAVEDIGQHRQHYRT